MGLYGIYFATLALFNAGVAHYCQRKKEPGRPGAETVALPSGAAGKQEAQKFRLAYFGVYTCVMAADWLQGPYMYTLYRDEKSLSETVVAALFTTGFISAGISASFVGSLADRCGRRAACLTFCIAYSASCLSVLSDDLMILFAGRALGGLSTTLLYSVFETWAIAAYHARELHESMRLGDMFSTSVTLSGIVAIVAGIVGEAVVRWTETKCAPFMLAIVCLIAAFAGIWRFWGESYGEAEGEKGAACASFRTSLLDNRILTLALTTTLFEGSMFLFVFFWTPALKSARAASGVLEAPPFGLIFSCFMAAMMLGSIISSTVDSPSERDVGRMLLSILALAAVSLLIPVLVRAEVATFWSFALFEICVGLYFPTMGRLKSELVGDASRAKIYALMRLPLNIFVVLALGITQEGDEHRDRVFTATGGLLLAAFFAARRWLV